MEEGGWSWAGSGELGRPHHAFCRLSCIPSLISWEPRPHTHLCLLSLILKPPLFTSLDPYLIISYKSKGGIVASCFGVGVGISSLTRLSNNICYQPFVSSLTSVCLVVILNPELCDWEASACFSLCTNADSIISPKSIILFYICHLAKFW